MNSFKSMAALVTSLEVLRASGERGILLADAVSEVGPQHLPLVLALFSLFTILVKLGYIDDDQVHWPPHRGKSDFHGEDAWAAIGLGSEACALLDVLTFASDDLWDVPVLSVDAPSFSFMGEAKLEVINPLFQDDEAMRLPPRYLLLSRYYYHQPLLIYETLEAKVAWWDFMNEPGELRPADAMPAQKWQSADALLDVGQRILDLELVPSREGMPTFLDDPTNFEDQIILPERPEPAYWYVNRANTRLALRQIYLEHGWPGPDYRREDAKQAIETFHDQVRLLDKAIGPWTQEGYQPALHAKGAFYYMTFLQWAAGPDALTSPTFDECVEPPQESRDQDQAIERCIESCAAQLNQDFMDQSPSDGDTEARDKVEKALYICLDACSS